MIASNSNAAGTETGQHGHEPDTVSVRGMALAGLGLLLLIFLSAGAIALAFKWIVPTGPLVTTNQQARRERMTPGVEPNQAYVRERIESAEREALSSYGWQDKEHSIVRIPIQRAMELMAERKLQVKWPNQEQEPPQDSEKTSSDVEPK